MILYILYKYHHITINFFNKGFWKDNDYSEKLYECLPNKVLCLPDKINHEEICDKKYVGPLCQTCNINFSKFGSFKCMPCYSKGLNYFIIFLMMFGWFFILIINIKSIIY